jgi:hypothetical protein
MVSSRDMQRDAKMASQKENWRGHEMVLPGALMMERRNLLISAGSQTH